MEYFPAALQDLADCFARLPGIGNNGSHGPQTLRVADGAATKFLNDQTHVVTPFPIQ